MRTGAEGDGLLIGAWHGLEPGGVTQLRADRIRACGVDFIHTYHVQGQDLERAFTVCDRAGLGCVCYDANLSGKTDYLSQAVEIETAADDAERVRRHLARYAGHPSYWGAALMDEPSCAQFARIRAMRELYRAAAPDQCCFVNLFPDYATLRQLGGSAAEAIGCGSYEEYVESFVKTVDPDFLSYDYYPLLEENGRPALLPSYLHNFEVVSRVCRQYGLPFWFFIQCVGFNDFFRMPTWEELRWQTYCALAYGVRVLQLFCYTTPPDVNGETYSFAMEDRQGRVTAQYGRVRRLIRELREFDRQYVSYRQVGVRYCAGKRPGVEQTPAEPPVGFAALHAVSSEYPVLIGCFAREDGHKALLLADLSLPWEKRRNEVSLRLSGVERVRVHPSGEARALGGGDGRLVLPLVESGGYFLELETTRA